MTNEELIERLGKLFAGRQDVYARGYPDKSNPNKYRWGPVREPMTAERWKEHLTGKDHYGCYPLDENDQVRWFAMDFDAGDFESAYSAARAQADALMHAGLIVYIERSRSGNGVHVWGFLNEWMPAIIVRQALEPLCVDHDTFDRMYPVQPGASDIGNLLALPYNGTAWKLGNACFLDHAAQPIPPREFVGSVIENRVEILQQLAERAEAKKPRQGTNKQPIGLVEANEAFRPQQPMTGALKLISQYGCEFMRNAWLNRRTLKEPAWYAAVQQTTVFENGREFAHAISKDHPGYDSDTVNAKFDHALQNPPVGCAYIHDNFPEMACKGCPMKAPYWQAKRPLRTLASEAGGDAQRVAAQKHLIRIRDREQGTLIEGIKTGNSGLDKYIRLRDGEMTVLGGRPSMGKTQLMIDLMLSVARQGYPVFGFSAETGKTAMYDRVLSRAAEVDGRAIKGELDRKLTREEWDRLERAAAELERLPLFVDFTTMSAEKVLRQVESTLLTNEIPLDQRYVTFFDYIQFGLKEPSESEYERISRLSTEFKYYSKVVEKATVVLSQLIRDAEGDDGPQLNWFKGSGTIEHDIDTGLIITGGRDVGDMVTRRLTVVKQKEGVANVAVDYRVTLPTGKWEAMDPDEIVERPPLDGPLGTFGEDE